MWQKNLGNSWMDKKGLFSYFSGNRTLCIRIHNFLSKGLKGNVIQFFFRFSQYFVCLCVCVMEILRGYTTFVFKRKETGMTR